MLIQDYFKDAEKFFLNDCYCPNEVYDLTGFFYKLYYPDDQFSYVMRIDDVFDDDTVTHVGISRNEFLLVFTYGSESENGVEGTIADMQRVPINKNNYLALKDMLMKVPCDEMHELTPDGDSLKSLNKILSMSDAIMVS